MNFEREIIMILKEVGTNGMPLRRIALNVFNIKNSLFEPLDQEDIYKEVGEWLRSTSAKSGGSVEKAETKGWYRINPNSAKVQQLLLEFQPHEEDEWMM